jgi:hypothetical protein
VLGRVDFAAATLRRTQRALLHAVRAENLRVVDAYGPTSGSLAPDVDGPATRSSRGGRPAAAAVGASRRCTAHPDAWVLVAGSHSTGPLAHRCAVRCIRAAARIGVGVVRFGFTDPYNDCVADVDLMPMLDTASEVAAVTRLITGTASR